MVEIRDAPEGNGPDGLEAVEGVDVLTVEGIDPFLAKSLFD